MCPSWAAANRPGSRDANRGSPTTHRRPAEVDPGIAAQARRNLVELGLDPLVITDDGEQGHPAAGPYDRIVATASVRRIPRAWLDQLRLGGVLLAPLDSPFGCDLLDASPVRAAQPPEGTSWRTSSSCTSAAGARPVHTQSWDGPRPPASSAGRSCRSRRGLVASRS
ncbi:protein-L-isoaspartate O-methyltransferase family protein [Streptomyces microflavus]|uniref:protein-L-isoaspartate O-methyltransferase family protein n=1 Tax=Streptomyces microflavus TaxID=1919 RepID=UPI0033AAF030